MRGILLINVIPLQKNCVCPGLRLGRTVTVKYLSSQSAVKTSTHSYTGGLVELRRKTHIGTKECKS